MTGSLVRPAAAGQDPPATPALLPSEYLVAALALRRGGHRQEPGHNGNFEVVVPLANRRLAHFWRNNDDPTWPGMDPTCSGPMPSTMQWR
jgi:hypothetical protein